MDFQCSFYVGPNLKLKRWRERDAKLAPHNLVIAAVSVLSNTTMTGEFATIWGRSSSITTRHHGMYLILPPSCSIYAKGVILPFRLLFIIGSWNYALCKTPVYCTLIIDGLLVQWPMPLCATVFLGFSTFSTHWSVFLRSFVLQIRSYVNSMTKKKTRNTLVGRIYGHRWIYKRYIQLKWKKYVAGHNTSCILDQCAPCRSCMLLAYALLQIHIKKMMNLMRWLTLSFKKKYVS